jgi:hypothetical protein
MTNSASLKGSHARWGDVSLSAVLVLPVLLTFVASRLRHLG